MKLVVGYATGGATDVVARLVAHVVEEQQSPSGRFIWETVEQAMAPAQGKGSAP